MPLPSVGQSTLTTALLNPYGSVLTNPIINGDFEIWQRGTPIATTASTVVYGPDRWNIDNSSDCLHNMIQSSDVPTIAALVPGTNYSFHADCTQADISIGSAQLCRITQNIEGYNWLPFAQKQFTVGFWVKDTITGIHCISARNSGASQSCVVEYTINASNTWEYKTVTFPASGVVSVANGWNLTNGVGLRLCWSLEEGSSFYTTAGAWQSGNFCATSNIVNSVSSTSNDFKLWGVNIGLGPTVAPYWPRLYPIELAMCKRYYRTFTLSDMFVPMTVDAFTNGWLGFQLQLDPVMRAAPTPSGEAITVNLSRNPSGTESGWAKFTNNSSPDIYNVTYEKNTATTGSSRWISSFSVNLNSEL